MSYLEKFLEAVLEVLCDWFGDLPMELMKKEARELLREELLGPDETLELLERFGVCRICGNAWPTWHMEDAGGGDGPHPVCEACAEVCHGR